jgi:hypothetical protein
VQGLYNGQPLRELCKPLIMEVIPMFSITCGCGHVMEFCSTFKNSFKTYCKACSSELIVKGINDIQVNGKINNPFTDEVLLNAVNSTAKSL